MKTTNRTAITERPTLAFKCARPVFRFGGRTRIFDTGVQLFLIVFQVDVKYTVRLIVIFVGHGGFRPCWDAAGRLPGAVIVEFHSFASATAFSRFDYAIHCHFIVGRTKWLFYEGC